MVAKYVMFIHFTDHKVEKCGNLEAESTTQKKHQTKKKHILSFKRLRNQIKGHRRRNKENQMNILF